MKAIRSYVIDTLERQNRHYKAIMVKNKHILCDPLPVAYTVIVSYPENSDTTYNPNVSEEIRSEFLDKAMHKAITSFIKNGNAGCDIESLLVTVVAHFRNSIVLNIPEVYWKDIRKQVLKKIK